MLKIWSIWRWHIEKICKYCSRLYVYHWSVCVIWLLSHLKTIYKLHHWLIFFLIFSTCVAHVENFLWKNYYYISASKTTYRVSKDGEEVKRWLNALTVDGGGDCPEYAMSGIKTGMSMKQYAVILVDLFLLILKIHLKL